MARVLVLGSNGQLGWELVRELQARTETSPKAAGSRGESPQRSNPHEVISLDFPDINLADEAGTRRTVQEVARGPTRSGLPAIDLIINAAAYTAVDQAETEPELAMATNVRAPEVLAEEARKIGAAFIHYSTDYVFDGTKGAPYAEADKPNPLGVYGASKLEGERAVERVGGAYLILRTAWLYSLRGDNFVTKVLKWAGEKDKLRIVGDQVSNPTWARELARATARIVAMAAGKGGRISKGWLEERAGLYHLAGDGYASRLDWAKEILELSAGSGRRLRAREIIQAYTEDFPTPAKRPLFSALDCGKFENTFGFRLPPWQRALAEALS